MKSHSSRLLCVTMCTSALSGCTTPPTIELLGFPECPNTATMRANLESAIESMHTDWVIIDVNQEALPHGDIRRGYPAPTILIDHTDLFGLPTPAAANMGCRVYSGGVPSAQLIEERLRAWKAHVTSKPV